MVKLEDIKKNAQIRGIQADELVTVIQVTPRGDSALTVYYKDSSASWTNNCYFVLMNLG